MSASDLLETALFAAWANDYYFLSEHYAAGLQALASSKGLPAQTTNWYINHIMPDLWECLHEAKDTVTDALMGHVSDQAVAGFIDLVANETWGHTIYNSFIELEIGELPQQKTVSYTKKSGLDDEEGYFTFYGPQHAQRNSHYKYTRYTLDVEEWAFASDLEHRGENPNQVYSTHDDNCFTYAVCRSVEADPRYHILDPKTRFGKIELEPGKSDPDVKVETDYSSTSHTLSDIPVKSGRIKKEPGVDSATK